MGYRSKVKTFIRQSDPGEGNAVDTICASHVYP